MKNIVSLCVVAMLFGLLLAPEIGAVSISAPPIQAQATVDGGPSLTIVLKKNDWNGSTINSMDFGTLKPGVLGDSLVSSPGGSTGTGAVLVWIWAQAHGMPFTITQNGTALTRADGAYKIPLGACTVVPVYVSNDNQNKPMPAGASLGTAGPWTTNNKTIYVSETGTTTYVGVRAYYAISDFNGLNGATEMVPTYQPAGVYSGTITITMTA